jgi:hypothetical protein
VAVALTSQERFAAAFKHLAAASATTVLKQRSDTGSKADVDQLIQVFRKYSRRKREGTESDGLNNKDHNELDPAELVVLLLTGDDSGREVLLALSFAHVLERVTDGANVDIATGLLGLGGIDSGGSGRLDVLGHDVGVGEGVARAVITHGGKSLELEVVAVK